MRSLFIGLGHMGGPMARRIETGTGHQFLSVYDADLTKSSHFTNGLASLDSIDFPAIFTMLPNDNALEQTFIETKLFHRIPKNSLIIDFSTTSPVLSRHLSAEALKYGHKFVDSPVSGGVEAAKNGTLSLLMGCEEAEIEIIKPILRCISTNQIFLQNRGNGCVAKICNNFVLMSCMVATCEAIAASAKNGVDPVFFMDVLNKCSGQSWVSSKYSPVPIDITPNAPCRKDFDVGFQSKLAIKDLNLARDTFARSGVTSSLLNNVIGVYEKIVRDGRGTKDIGVYIKEFL